MAWFRRKTLTPDVIAIDTATRETVVLTARAKHAARLLKAFLEAQSDLEVEDRNDEAVELALDVMVALALAPRAAVPEVPVVPGRAS